MEGQSWGGGGASRGLLGSKKARSKDNHSTGQKQEDSGTEANSFLQFYPTNIVDHHYIPGTVLGTSYTLPHLIFFTT